MFGVQNRQISAAFNRITNLNDAPMGSLKRKIMIKE